MVPSRKTAGAHPVPKLHDTVRLSAETTITSTF